MSVYLKCLVDTILEARADGEWWMPVIASLCEQPAFGDLPPEVATEVRRFLKDGKSATTRLSELWTSTFRALERGEPGAWSPRPPAGCKRLDAEKTRDWNQILAFNELSVLLGGDSDGGLLVHDHGILDIPLEEVALQLRRLCADFDALGFKPAAVLPHDKESLPPALALAERYGCGIEAEGAANSDCLYLLGNLTYAGALERARATLEEIRPDRCVTAVLLLTEHPNAMRLIPDVIGYQLGSAALPWGQAAGVGVLLRSVEDEEDGMAAVADRKAFAESRDTRPAVEIAEDIVSWMKDFDAEMLEEHAMYSAPALRRILSRKKGPVQPFGWRMREEGEEEGDWHTLLPPFPNLFGTPFSELPEHPTVSQLREIDHAEEQMQFMDWVDPALQNPNEVWVKQDVRGETYTHYFSVVRHEKLDGPVVFVVETVPHGEDLALNSFGLFFDPSKAEELRFGQLAYRRERPSLN